jgi:integrase
MSVERRVALVVESSRKLGELPSWAAAWHENGRPVKRRVGRAWLAPTGSRDAKSDGKTYGKTGAWTQRRGRPRDGALDEVAARVRAAEVAKQAASEQRAAHQAADRTERTFRALARQWQKHMLRTGAHKPSTARDIASVLAEPGVAHRRGAGVTAGRVMQHLGDLRAEEVTVAHVERVFDAYDDAGASPRTVNKAREIVRAIYNYGADPDLGGWGLAANPASRTARRRVSGAAGVRSFEIEQVEAIARTAESGAWREPRPADWTRDELTVAEEAEENHQLADLIRLAAYTGLRQGELVVLRWRDADFAGRVLTVERALSGTVELSRGTARRPGARGTRPSEPSSELHRTGRLRVRVADWRAPRPLGPPAPLQPRPRRRRRAPAPIPRTTPHRSIAVRAQARPDHRAGDPRPRQRQDDRALPARAPRILPRRRRYSRAHTGQR